jgi:uncharacterized hydrophobic protein (TIGR00271 family)
MKYQLLELFNLRHDQDDAENIDRAIRSNTRLAGTNLWVLMFAILIASIGLNVNSTAVIIGAMLISPLMGPIIGIGYGAGINDIPLIRLALRNLGIFLLISLGTSTLYFWLSPLTQAHSELLARTTPSLWDVLIAFCGGAAGIIALTRRERSPIIPGVAIATALMPPLCTAGYGLASGNLKFFGGAFFLFAINSVFIAFATLLLVKFLRLPQHQFFEEHQRRHARLLIGLAVAATLLPSIYMAYQLVRAEYFTVTANRLLDQAEKTHGIMVLSREISTSPNRIILTLGGETPPANLATQLETTFDAGGLAQTAVEIRYAGGKHFDASKLRQELRTDVLGDTLRLLTESGEKIRLLEAENQRLRQASTIDLALEQEIRALYPKIHQLVITHGQLIAPQTGNAGTSSPPIPEPLTLVLFAPGNSLGKHERQRLQNWLKTRLPGQQIRVIPE